GGVESARSGRRRAGDSALDQNRGIRAWSGSARDGPARAAHDRRARRRPGRAARRGHRLRGPRSRSVRAARGSARGRPSGGARAGELVLAELEDDEGWVRESAAHGAAEGFGPGDRPALTILSDALAFAREDPTRLNLLRALAAICAHPAAEDWALVGTARGML